jgi:autotransporter strand-loop-strand O-heptosyltransferase
MNPLKIRGNAAFIGTTGFNSHSQNFFSSLSKLRPVEIRNFSVGSTWAGQSDEPHNNEPYMTDEFKKLLTTQSIWLSSSDLQDEPIYTKWPNPGKPEIDIVLGETNHAYFYQNYFNYAIAYNVWEATRQPQAFFERLLSFNELWVPSKWQREKSIEQGYPADRVFVVPEGVDSNLFYPAKSKIKNKRFTFAIVGRWEPRKFTIEMIKCFLETFSKDEPIDLILSADNRFARDGFSTTEERLHHYGLTDPRIKVIHFQTSEEYAELLRTSNVFLSCSRSEGWNLPLLEAMASGTPAIYSNASGQLEFAEGRGLPVKVLGAVPAIGFEDGCSWYEPDFEDLKLVMRDAYQNWETHKEAAMKDAPIIREQFSWERAAKLANDRLNQIRDTVLATNRTNIKKDSLIYNSVRGGFIEIISGEPGEFLAEFIDNSTGQVEFSKVIENNMWIRTNRNYYVDWGYRVKDLKSGKILLDQGLSLKDSRVFVAIESRSLGDNLSWLPAVEEFRKKHECKMICSTFWNGLFRETYPAIEFVEPGSPVSNLAALYTIGWYYDDKNEIRKSMNPKEVKTQPMKKTAFDILGLEYSEIKPKLKLPKLKKSKKIAIATHGTCQAKYWNNPTGWQELVDWCNSEGYEVVLLSAEPDGHMGNVRPTGVRALPHGPIEGVIAELVSAEAFVGIGSGLTWLAWATNTPTVLISGFSEAYTEMQDVVRVCAPAGKCSGCFNSHRLDPADWNWCPVNKGTVRQFECSKSISSVQVINSLKNLLESNR